MLRFPQHDHRSQSAQLFAAISDPANPHEVGWRLRQDRWGQGYASEAARALATFAFERLNAPLLCAVCKPENADSAQVMTRLGMSYRGLERW